MQWLDIFTTPPRKNARAGKLIARVPEIACRNTTLIVVTEPWGQLEVGKNPWVEENLPITIRNSVSYYLIC